MFFSSASSDHTFLISFQSCVTGLLTPIASSTNSSPNRPILIGSKKNDAADVTRAASQIRVLWYISDDPRKGYDVKRTVLAVCIIKTIRVDAISRALTLCTADSLIL